MFDKINIHSSQAVYRQIENLFRFAVASGELKGDDRLPSVRELSERLDVNPNTVAKAYRDLEVLGLVYTRRGMGIYVVPGVARRCQRDCRTEVLSKLHEVCSEARASGFDKSMFIEGIAASFSLPVNPYGEVPPSVIKIAKESGRKAAKNRP